MNETFRINVISHELDNYVKTATVVKSMDNFMQLASSIRLMLHENFYNDTKNINILIEHLNILDLFNIEYNELDRTLQLKIKKTNMKKYTNYSHCATFYYRLFNEILLSFYYNSYNELDSIFNIYGPQYGVTCNLQNLLDNRMISMIYSITSILDNIVIIHL